MSVVVPVCNAEATLAELVERLEETLPSCADRYEVILVNDGSRDRSWVIIRRLAAERPWLRGIKLMRNYGQHNATVCGIRAARYRTTVTMDDHLQNPPSQIPALLRKLDEGYDVVHGTPVRAAQSVWRTLGSWGTRRAIAVATRSSEPAA